MSESPAIDLSTHNISVNIHPKLKLKKFVFSSLSLRSVKLFWTDQTLCGDHRSPVSNDHYEGGSGIVAKRLNTERCWFLLQGSKRHRI